MHARLSVVELLIIIICIIINMDYHKEYYIKNKSRIHDYYVRNHQRIHLYYINNKDYKKEYNRQYYLSHKSKTNELKQKQSLTIYFN